jgi:hypothetical protein
LDFSKLLDGMSWFAEKINEAIWSIVYGAASDIASDSFEFVMKYVLVETDPNRIVDFSSYLGMMQSIALALLLFAISWEGVKYHSGTFGEEITIQALLMRTFFSSVSIFFLPFAMNNFLIKINNLLVKMIVAGGINITPGDVGPFSLLIKPYKLSLMIIVLYLIFAIAFLVLGIVGGIRYMEIVILTLIAPLAAVSIVRGGELLEVWVRESIAVVFTQSLQVFLLWFLLGTIGKMGEGDVVELYLITIGCLVLMIAGPQGLRKFVYNTGVGSTGTRAIGNAGRMAVYKSIGKGALK